MLASMQPRNERLSKALNAFKLFVYPCLPATTAAVGTAKKVSEVREDLGKLLRILAERPSEMVDLYHAKSKLMTSLNGAVG